MNQQNAFTVARKSLAAVLKHAAKVTERRNTIPILSNVLLAFERDGLKLTATDLDIQLQAELPAATDGAGRLTVALKALSDAIGKFKGEHVRIADMGGNRLSVSCTESGAAVRLPTISADEWPLIARGDMPPSFTMETTALQSAVGTVLPFVSSEETRYYLMGIYLHTACLNPAPRCEEHEALCDERAALGALDQADVDAFGQNWRDVIAAAERGEGDVPEEFAARTVAMLARATRRAEMDARIDVLEAKRTRPDALRFATTDGHRLGRVTQPLPEGAADMPDAIVPTKACKVLQAIIGKKPDRDTARVAVAGTKIEFRYGRFVLLSKLIDGTFPDYGRVIPSTNDHRLTVPASEFAGAVGSVAAICNERTRAITLAMSSDDAAVILSTKSAENGVAAAVFEGGTYAPPEGFGAAERVVGFNAAYLQQCLAAFGDSNVTFSIADAAAPMLIESDDHPETTMVLMPMRVDGGITTRADVARLTMTPWEAFKAEAKGTVAAFAAVEKDVAPDLDAGNRKAVRKALGRKVQAVVDYLADTGTPRPIARLMAKAELSTAIAEGGPPDALYSAIGDPERYLAIIAAYQRGPRGGGFGSLKYAAVVDSDNGK